MTRTHDEYDVLPTHAERQTEALEAIRLLLGILLFLFILGLVLSGIALLGAA